MADTTTKEQNSKGTRKPSKPRPIYAVYRINANGDGIDMLALTRDSDVALSALDNNPGAKVHKEVPK